jgi:hypothetical protein
MSTFINERQRVQINLLMLFSTFTGSRPATLLTNNNSSSNNSQESSADDLSNTTLVNNNNRDTLVDSESDLKAQTTKPGTIYYGDINLFFLRNPNNPERDILITEVNF